MSRDDLKEIIKRVINQIQEVEDDTPSPGCIYRDVGPCDGYTTYYGIGEEG